MHVCMYIYIYIHTDTYVCIYNYTYMLYTHIGLGKQAEVVVLSEPQHREAVAEEDVLA